MKMKIKITNKELNYISIFQNLTNASVEDCVIFNDSIIFLVNKHCMGRAIGKHGKNIKMASKLLKKDVIIVESSENAEEFAKKAFKKLCEKDISNVKIINKGGKTVMEIKLKNAIAIKNKNIKIIKKLLERKFGIENLEIKR